MHGQIGEREHRVETRRDLDFYYRTRATLLDSYRRTGESGIDYDFYRARARALRNRARRDAFMRLIRFVRPLLGIGAIAAAIWIMPTRSENCSVCDLHRIVSGNAASVILPDDAPMRP